MPKNRRLNMATSVKLIFVCHVLLRQTEFSLAFSSRFTGTQSLSLTSARLRGRGSFLYPPLVSRKKYVSLHVFTSTTATVEEESLLATKEIGETAVITNDPSTTSSETTEFMGDLTLDMMEDVEETNEEEYRRGLLTIGFITLLFASNSPVLHAAFSESSPPPVLLLNAAVSVVALTGLLFGGSTLESNTPLPKSLLKNNVSKQEQDIAMEIKAGLELGLWKFLGTVANLYGLSLTTASHGAFLIQLTTLIVPVVQGIMGVPIPKRIQFSVVLALAGVFLFTHDAMNGGSSSVGSIGSQSLGDSLCVVAAGFYATYDLRLFSWGKLVPARNLITNKIATQACFSILLLLGLGWSDAMEFIQTATEASWLSLVPVVMWSGVAVNALAPFLQVGGQQAVGPTRAQTLYASQPLWASIMSYLFLGETIGVNGLVGGGAFLVALSLAATTEAPDPDCGQDVCEV